MSVNSQVIMAMKNLQQVAIPPPFEDPLPICSLDTINALVLNKNGEALIFELARQGGSGVYWELLCLEFTAEVDPFTAVQTALLHQTGYQTNHWSYLGTHVMTQEESAGVGYYFCAQQATQTTMSPQNSHPLRVAKWVPLTDLRYALLDGRILLTSHALTASLALLTLDK